MVRKSRIRRRSANAPPAMKKRPPNALIIRAVVLVMMIILCLCSAFFVPLFLIETTFSLESDNHISDGENGFCLLVLSDFGAQ